MRAEDDEPIHLEIPFYRQHWDFTCGPASLMMAMKYLDPETRLGKDLEIAIWREANMVVSRGSGRFGLAYAAAVRGFYCRVTSSSREIDYVGRLASHLDDAEMRLLEEQFSERRARCRERGIRERVTAVTPGAIRGSLLANRVPLLLTSTRWYCGEDLPHWVAVSGIDSARLYYRNPDDPRPRRRAVARPELGQFAGYRGSQAMVEIGRDLPATDGGLTRAAPFLPGRGDRGSMIFAGATARVPGAG